MPIRKQEAYLYSPARRYKHAVLESFFGYAPLTIGDPMPLAQLYIAAGRDDAKKKALIEKVTQAFVDALGVKPESVWITVQDVPKEAWGVGGKTLAERG